MTKILSIFALLLVNLISLGQSQQIIPGGKETPIFLLAPEITSTPSNMDEFWAYFSADADKCRKEYGDNFYQSCNRPLGNEGKISFGIKMSPELPGTWHWDNDYGLVFNPSNPWNPDTTYTVTLAKGLYPDHVSFSKSSFEIKSAPLEATIEKMTFLQDPQNPDKKLVSGKVLFNYPINPESFEQHCGFHYETRETVDPKKPAPAVKKLPMKTTFSADLKEVTVVATLDALPPQDTNMLLELTPGLLPQYGTKGTGKIFQERVEIPSLTSYLKVKNASSTTIPGDKNSLQQVLAVQLSVKTTSEDLKKHLKVYLLPEHHPIEKNAVTPHAEPHVWRNLQEINNVVEKALEPITLTPLPLADTHSDLHSFTYTQQPGRYLYVVVDKGLKSFGDYTLTQPFQAIVPVATFPKELEILQQGSVLSLTGDKTLSILARGQKEIRFQVSQILPQFINTLVTQTEGSFDKPDFVYGSFKADNLAEITSKDVTLDLKSSRDSQYTTFDFSKHLSGQKHGLFFFNVQSKEKTKDGETIGAQKDQRFVLVTDLGFVVKTNADHTQEVFVLSLKEGTPVEAAQVSVLGANGQPVFQGSTSKNGNVPLPDLSTLKNDKQPIAFVVTKGDDLSFMPYDREDRKLNYSEFNTDGTEFGSTGLKAYLFSDRGLYRPGETIQTGMIIKSHDWEKDLTDLPLHFIVQDPRGKKVHDAVVKVNAQGFIEASFPTTPSSPTGHYTLALHVDGDGKPGSLLNSTTVTVEEFMPDTLRLKTKFNAGSQDTAQVAWVHPDNLEAQIDLMNLYGTPAQKRRVTGSLTLESGAFFFKEYKDYTFFDASKADTKQLVSPLSDQTTDDQGHAVFKLDLSRFEKASYNLALTVRGYEADGGRGVGVLNRILVSPLSYVVGAKIKGSARFKPGSPGSVDFIALNPQLKKIPVNNLKAVLYKKDFINTLVQKDDGTFTYDAVPTEKKLNSKDITLADKDTSLTLDTKTSGDFILALEDDKGHAVSKVYYSVLGATTLNKKDKGQRAPLQITLDKESYEPGDIMEISLSGPYTGSGLITLESDRVLTFKFFQAKEKDTLEKITLPKNFTGKGYINVALLRDMKSEEIYVNPLTYAVHPFMAGIASKTLDLSIKVPEKIKPGAPFEIQYAAKTPGKIILFGVDEGILQAGHYHTPDPLYALLQDKALEVETSQILDLLMAEHNLFKKLSAFGGDGEAKMAMALRKKPGESQLNPFARQVNKPAIFWSGLLDVAAEEKSFKATLPDHFNGSLRVMAVAVSPERAAAQTKDMLVQGDLIVSPSLPEFVAPGDTFESNVTVANTQDKGDKKPLELTVKVSENLKLAAPAPATLDVAAQGEKTFPLQLTALDGLGEGFIEVTVTNGTTTTVRKETLSVRPALARQTVNQVGILKPGESKTLTLAQDFYPALREQSVQVSALPVPVIQGLLKYLSTYPYGCTEQLLSRIFPGILLMDMPEFALKNDVLQEEVDKGVAVLRSRQNADGGFASWSTGASDPYLSVYALDFMTQALEKRINIPTDLMDKTLNYTRTMVNTSVRTLDDGRVKAYGIYLLTRNGEVTTNYLINLLTDLEKFHKDTWHSDLTAVYVASTYKLMLQDTAAQKVLDGFDPLNTKNSYGYNFYGPMTKYSQYMSLLARHFPESFKTMKPEVLNGLITSVAGNDYATNSSVYGINAIVDYSKSLAKMPETTAAIQVKDTSGKTMDTKPEGTLYKSVSLPQGSKSVDIKANNALLFYQLSQMGFPKTAPKEPIHKGIEAVRTYTDLEGKPLANVALGQEIVATITVRSTGNRTLENVALVDLLPGGFELIRDKVGVVNSIRPESVDKRADRLILYATVHPAEKSFDPQVKSEQRTYVYHLRAIAKGTFALPPIYAESMYDQTLTSTGPTAQITVTAP